MSIATLEELFLHDLKDVYDAEKQLVKALPRMARSATSEELKAAFEEHATVTEGQVERLEKVFELLDKTARGKHCPGMEGLVEEGKELMEEEEPGTMLDAALIGAAQKVEHYEIAAYGTMIANAERLGMNEAVTLLNESLEEEKETDAQLSELASQLQLETNGAEEADGKSKKGRRSRR